MDCHKDPDPLCRVPGLECGIYISIQFVDSDADWCERVGNADQCAIYSSPRSTRIRVLAWSAPTSEAPTFVTFVGSFAGVEDAAILASSECDAKPT